MQGVTFVILNINIQFEQITWIKLPGEIIDEGTIKVHVPCLVETQVFVETVYIYVEVKPFSDAVAALENGAHTSAPVQTQFGWHVILREDSRESTPPPFESVKDEMKASVQQRKFQDYLAELRTAAEE